MHTFGVGSGADINLIEKTAYAGFGHHHIIYDESQIEEKVIEALTQTHLDYQVLSDLQIFNSANKPMQIDFQPKHIKQGELCEWSSLLGKTQGEQAHSYKGTIVDPNTCEKRQISGTFQNCSNNALYSLCVNMKMNQLIRD